MRVVVVGAGLGGLAAAVAARRAGHEVTVLERTPVARESGAGVGVMPNGVRALDALGLGGPVRDRAAPLDVGGGLRDRHGRPLLVADQAVINERTGAPLAVVPRTWLHRLLADALPADVLRTGATVSGVRTGADGAEVICAAGERIVADLVVAADGARSRLRAALFADHPGLARSGEYAARAIAPVPGDVPLVAGELLDRRTGERFGCLPMATGGVYWYSTWRGEIAPADPADRRRWLRERRDDWHPCVRALVEATPADAVHTDELVHLGRPLPALFAGRVALLGDAGHAMTPDLGQGACQAFEDAATLATLLHGIGPADVPAALSEYDTRRRPRTTAMMRESRRTNRILTLTGRGAWLRDTAMRRVPRALATRALLARCRFEPGPLLQRV